MAEKQSKTAYQILISGMVQGVGFRPFVYRQAKKFGICGTVRNMDGKVEILAMGEDVAEFMASLRSSECRPPHSFIERMETNPLSPLQAGETSSGNFIILESHSEFKEPRWFPPDLALCDDCRAELFDEGNRRCRHFFNTCVNCGPRYSIFRDFPYDRKNTSMDEFPMCEECLTEYHEPGNRRFHAETISCHHCGPRLFYQGDDKAFQGEEAFQEALKDLPKGIAIKGIGGYHLACSPYDSEAVQGLRLLKGREKRPFALMFRDLDAIKQICEVNESEASLLLSHARPIVLLDIKHNPFVPEVSYRADGRCGCFLPYTPLQELLLAEFPCLVMTSANLSSSPIIKDEKEIFALTAKVLYHGREIVRSVEDSVMQVAFLPDRPNGQAQLIRRARGHAPSAIPLENPHDVKVLAFGGDLKAAFGFSRNQAFLLSQYMGDLENASAFQQYEDNIADVEHLFSMQPEALACDAHPRYFSTELAKRMSAERALPLVQVFHHHAHIASVMAEHKLSKVLGIAFDGSGYGEDGAIWGGEFLLCEEGECNRIGHLAYAKILGADDASKDAAKTTACYLHGLGLPACQTCLLGRQVGRPTHPNRDLIEAALANNINTSYTSSMGRLFDVAASLLDICHFNDYEGECATLLQYQAEEEAKSGTLPLPMRFTWELKDGIFMIGYEDIVQKCLERALEGGSGAALGFHHAICDMMDELCIQIREEEDIGDVALSGGVFQNSFLLELATNRLAASGFQVFKNEAVPCNDGGLALGQAFIGIKK